MNFEAAPFLFLRPVWLWMLLLIPPLLWWLLQRRRASSALDSVVDAHLREAVIETPTVTRSPWSALWIAAMLSIGIVALAGPSWQQSKLPLWSKNDPLVIVEDMSTAMLQTDVEPSRLDVARTKVAAVLKDWQGNVGMVAFAEQPFTVSPLTEDPQNVAVFLDPLAPDVMPRDGHDLSGAIGYAVELLHRDAQLQGTIWVLTTDADAAAVRAAQAAKASGYTVSVMGVGAAATDDMQSVAKAGGGRFVQIDRTGDADLRSLALERANRSQFIGERAAMRDGYVREDNGFWLLPLLLILLPLAFRRRHLALTATGVLSASLLLTPQPVLAQDLQGDWWATLPQKEARRAQQADQAYKNRKYAEAARLYSTLPSAQARYNHANALAKSGQLQEALTEYDKAIAADPKNRDAKINRAIVAAALKANPPGSGGNNKRKGNQQPSPTPKGSQGQQAQPPQQAQGSQGQQPQRRGDDINPATGKPYTPEERRKREQLKKQLSKVKDDPGGLLRAKFYLEYIRRFQAAGGSQ